MHYIITTVHPKTGDIYTSDVTLTRKTSQAVPPVMYTCTPHTSAAITLYQL